MGCNGITSTGMYKGGQKGNQNAKAQINQDHNAHTKPPRGEPDTTRKQEGVMNMQCNFQVIRKSSVRISSVGCTASETRCIEVKKACTENRFEHTAM